MRINDVHPEELVLPDASPWRYHQELIIRLRHGGDCRDQVADVRF